MVVAEVQLAADLGHGIPWLIQILSIAVIITTSFFVYVILSTRSRHALLAGFDKAKHELHKYHAERYWGIFVAGLLIYMWVLGFQWMPPVAFQPAIENPEEVQTIKVTAGQWFWTLEQEVQGDTGNNQHTYSSQITIKAGDTVKFVARSQDVNHGFAILSSSNTMDSPLIQMQVVPGYDNIVYYTFDKPGIYTIRCFEYCGWNHPYMLSQISIEAV
jgi:cytochrome c oxidase subunit 2